MSDGKILTSHIACTFKLDRIGNLLVWEDHVNPASADINKAAYVQDSQNIDSTLDCTDMTMEDRESLDHGWPVFAQLYDEMFCALFNIDF